MAWEDARGEDGDSGEAWALGAACPRTLGGRLLYPGVQQAIGGWKHLSEDYTVLGHVEAPTEDQGIGELCVSLSVSLNRSSWAFPPLARTTSPTGQSRCGHGLELVFKDILVGAGVFADPAK